MGKRNKTANILEIDNYRVKQTEIWDSGVLVEHICKNFDLALFKVIWGSIGAPALFSKIQFYNASSALRILLSAKETF